nr:FKBP12-interacting protein of 37 kDa-like [Arachis hypogaea]
MDAARDILVDGIKNLPQNKQLLEVVTINNISLCLTLLFPFILSNLVIDSLQNCKDTLATCQNELEAAKSEIQSWHSSIQNEPCVPAGATPEPKMLPDYLQALKSSEESLREQLEKAKKKEAAFIVTFAKREQEIAELKIGYSKVDILCSESRKQRIILMDQESQEASILTSSLRSSRKNEAIHKLGY